MHDKRIANTIGYCVPSGTILYQNTGFQGFTLAGINIIQPKKGPRGRELTSTCARYETEFEDTTFSPMRSCSTCARIAHGQKQHMDSHRT